jgi:hypothetical protein
LDDEENLQETTIFDGKNHGFNMFQHWFPQQNQAIEGCPNI